MKERFTVTGMSCSACSAGIERALHKKRGVVKAEVFLIDESMTVEYREEEISKEEIFSIVQGLGYGICDFQEKKRDKKKGMRLRFLMSLAFLLPLLYLSMGGMISLPQTSERIGALLQAILSLAVIIINYKFFVNGAKAVFHGVANMDTLVALGSGISYAYSLYLTVRILLGNLSHAHLFYESAAMILTLVTLGKWLEERSTKKTGQEVEKLIRLMPDTVNVLRGDKEISIAFSEVVIGDFLIVRQGDYVPVDGVVLEGNGYVDRSAVTGESMPVEVKEGSSVTGADTLKSGFLKIKAQRVGKDTTLSQIVHMVKEAGASKAPIQKIADKIAGVFVPIVALLSAVTFLVWFVLTNEVATATNYAISVLVISCPCALGLATPVAVMASMGRGMALGVLFKDAEALQKAEKINCILLDKTATLTMGNPKVTGFICEKNADVLLKIAGGIERQSNHPIATCIVAFAQEKTDGNFPNPSEYTYETGKGARAVIDGKTYLLGNAKFLREKLQKQANGYEKSLSMQGKTVVFLASEEEILAIISIADTLKDTSRVAVEKMKNRGLHVAMLTGDNEAVAKAVAKEVGIDEYFSEALPSDKTQAVKRVQSVGGNVAMVGDGINDSPALKTADLGIAMGTGTDIAIDSADVVIIHGDLEAVVDAFDLSKATVRNIKQNLFWAFFYNLLALPLAGGALAFIGLSLSPMIAAGCMSCSSLFVVGNALRLTRFKGGKKNEKEMDFEENKENERRGTEMKKTITIEGMMCSHCVMHVKKALLSVDGVREVEVNLEGKTAIVSLDKLIDNASLSNAVEEAGYEVIEIR